MPQGSASSDQPPSSALPWPEATVRLLPGEAVLATSRFDLDASLQFSDGWIVLTTRRVIADRPASATQSLTGSGPWVWTIGPHTRLDVQLRSAVGRVELSEGDRIVARWR